MRKLKAFQVGNYFIFDICKVTITMCKVLYARNCLFVIVLFFNTALYCSNDCLTNRKAINGVDLTLICLRVSVFHVVSHESPIEQSKIVGVFKRFQNNDVFHCCF